MSEDLRSKFKGGTLQSIKQEQDNAKANVPSTNNYPSRPGFLKIEDGKNVFRVAPSHDVADPAYRAKTTVTLDCEVNEYDSDGKETGKKEIKRKSIFVALAHSKTVKEDPCLLYIQYVNRRANDEIQDKDERKKFVAPINGWRGKDGTWNWGINPMTSFVCYAWDSAKKFGRLELFAKMIEDMKKVCVEQSDDDQPITPDIFTDPDEGYPLVITRGKNDKGKTESTISCSLPNFKKGETGVEFFEKHRLTDDQLIELAKVESLKELFEDVYTTKDFELAVDGLKRFDEKHKYGIFENEEFLEKLANIQATVPAPKSRDEKDIEEMIPEKKKDAPVEATKGQQPTPSVPAVPVPKMKTFVKEYIADNYGADYSLPDLSKEELTKWYDLSVAGEELPFSEDGVLKEEPKVAEPTKKVETPVVDAPTEEEVDPELAAQIALLRNRRK